MHKPTFFPFHLQLYWCIEKICSPTSWSPFDSCILWSFTRTNASRSQLCLCRCWNPWYHWQKLCMHIVFLFSFTLIYFGTIYFCMYMLLFIFPLTCYWIWCVRYLKYHLKTPYNSANIHVILAFCHCTLTVPYYVYGSH